MPAAKKARATRAAPARKKAPAVDSPEAVEQWQFATVPKIALLTGANKRTVAQWVGLPGFPPVAKKRGRVRMWHVHDVWVWCLEREIAQRTGGAGEKLDLTIERARVARATAELKELELAEKRGTLIPRGIAESALVGAVHQARTTLLAAHGRCADIRPDLPPEVIELVRAIHAEALEALAAAPVPTEKTNGATGP